MQKTSNYKLNQWEPHDEIKVEDFNAAIDAALNSLTTAVEAKGNCTLMAGTYTGKGEYGKGTELTLTFVKQPWAVFIGRGGYTTLMIRNNSHGVTVDYNGSVRALYPTWNTNGSVSWYSAGNARCQMNLSGTAYTYLALLD